MDAVTLLIILTLPNGVRHELSRPYDSMAQRAEAKVTAEHPTLWQPPPGMRRTMYCLQNLTITK